MKTTFGIAIALSAVALMASPAWAKTEENAGILRSYESVSMALANDDLAGAQRAAGDLSEAAKSSGQPNMAEHAFAITKSDSLETARDHFKAMSSDAARLAAGSKRYHVVKCSMLGATWVQSGDKVMNPYMGKKMQQCGSRVKGQESASMRGMKGMDGMKGDDGMEDMEGMDGMGCCSKK